MLSYQNIVHCNGTSISVMWFQNRHCSAIVLAVTVTVTAIVIVIVIAIAWYGVFNLQHAASKGITSPVVKVKCDANYNTQCLLECLLFFGIKLLIELV
jgi:hypothetical protein